MIKQRSFKTLHNPEEPRMNSMANQPDWVDGLIDQYVSGSSSFFVLHGNVDDAVGSLVENKFRLETLTDFLGLRLLHQYDLVLHYDVGRGLRIHPGKDNIRESRMKELLGNMWPGLTRLPQEPTPMLRLMDRLVTRLLNDAKDGIARKAAFLFDYADLICPAEGREPEHLATFLNWARNPKFKRTNIIFILMTNSLTRLDPILVQSGFTTEIQVPMPGFDQREEMIRQGFPQWSDQAERLAALSAGLTLMNLDSLLRLAGGPDQLGPTSGDPTGIPAQKRVIGLVSETKDDSPSESETTSKDTWAMLTRTKKQLIEAQSPGLLEFVEPKFNLGLVAGHTSAKQRLANDAQLIKAGNLDAVPMGYLLCGPVGVGKTFMALCYAGSVGIPCVTLKNFRSKYVGETEANLDKILRVLRELGPVAVIIDEADAAVGNRGQEGDAGTSSRVFAQLAAQMGDTRYRGKTIWFLLTCRPDLLPVDLKRQGRCEEHIPLFYPETREDRVDMFLAMGKKLDMHFDEDQVPETEPEKELSGADIESLLTRVRRESLVQERTIDRDLIDETLKVFRSPRSPEHELQILAAIMECSDLRYLPAKLREQAESPEGWDDMTLRFYELKARFSRL
jgi:SpoVK/Ycf46/Vps4 family AAA+-type ATPase